MVISEIKPQLPKTKDEWLIFIGRKNSIEKQSIRTSEQL
jgi:hypothetical protein